MTLLLVAVAGAVGAPARYAVDVWLDRRFSNRFPWGILAVNVLGSLLLGLLVGLHRADRLSATPLAVLGAGFCGAFTTFSTHALQSVELALEGAARVAAYNVVGTLLACCGAAAVGLAVATL